MFKNLNASALGVTGHQSEIIELALTYGFRGFDLDIVDFANRVKRRGLDYAARLIRSANIRTGTFTLPLDWDTDDDDFQAALAKLPEYAQAAADVGCTRCVATILPAGDKRPYHENFEFHRRRFADICGALAPAGVTLGVGFRAAADLRKGQAFQFIHDLDATTLLSEHGRGPEHRAAAGRLGPDRLRADRSTTSPACRSSRSSPCSVADLPRGRDAGRRHASSRGCCPAAKTASIDVAGLPEAAPRAGLRRAGHAGAPPRASWQAAPRRDREAGRRGPGRGVAGRRADARLSDPRPRGQAVVESARPATAMFHWEGGLKLTRRAWRSTFAGASPGRSSPTPTPTTSPATPTRCARPRRRPCTTPGSARGRCWKCPTASPSSGAACG